MANDLNNLVRSGAISLYDFDFGIKLPLKKIILVLTTACNMACKYCFEKENVCRSAMMTHTVIKNSVEYLMQHAKDNDVEIEFFGGEPLLVPDLIEYSVIYAKKRAEIFGKNVRFFMTTNGTKLTKKMADYLSVHNFTVQVSIDGTKDGHNANRIFSNGSQSYNSARRGLEYLQKRRVSCNVFTVVTRDLLTNDCKWFKHIGDISCDNFNFCFVGCRDNKIFPSENQILHCLSHYEQYLKHSTDNYRNKRHSVLPALNYQKFLENNLKRISGCGAGTEYILILPDGTINLCHRTSAYTKYNINDMPPPSDVWHEYARTPESPVCKDCWAKYLCGGGCTYNSRIFCSDPKPAWWECEKKKLEIETAIKVVYNDCIAKQ